MGQSLEGNQPAGTRGNGASSGRPSSHEAQYQPGSSFQGSLYGNQQPCILQAKRSLQDEKEEVCSDPSRISNWLAISHGLHLLPAAAQELNHALFCRVPPWPDRVTHQTCNFYGIVGSKQKEATSSSSPTSGLCHSCPQGEAGEAGGRDGGEAGGRDGEGEAGKRGKNKERGGGEEEK